MLESIRRPYEIIFVDDASTDRSFDLLSNLVETDARLKVIRLRRNFGQTAALAAGFHEARGEVIVSMDGDLQHDPEDLPGAARQDRRRVTTSPAAGASTAWTTRSPAGCPRASPTG